MSSYGSRQQVKLYGLIALTGMLFGAELVASQVSKSFVLLADAYHTLYNFMSLLLLVIGYRTSKARTLKNTFGWARLEVLGILVNILFLCALYFALTMGSLLHLLHAGHDPIRPLYPLLMLSFGLLGLLANLICFVLIGGFSHHQECYLSIEGSEVHLGYVVGDQQPPTSYCDAQIRPREPHTSHTGTDDDTEQSQMPLDGCNQSKKSSRKSGYNRLLFGLLRDTSSCLLVVISACAVMFLKEPLGGALADYADSVTSLLGVALQIATTYPFLKETGMILLQTVPPYIDIEQLKTQIMKEFPVIQNVHELHVWKQSKTQVIATVHIIVSTPSVYTGLSSKLQTFFQQKGIASATVQPEFHGASPNNMPDLLNGCILPCAAGCLEPNCCRPENKNQIRKRHGHSHEHGHHHGSHHHQTELSIVTSPKDARQSLLVENLDLSNIDKAAETSL